MSLDQAIRKFVTQPKVSAADDAKIEAMISKITSHNKLAGMMDADRNKFPAGMSEAAAMAASYAMNVKVAQPVGGFAAGMRGAIGAAAPPPNPLQPDLTPKPQTPGPAIGAGAASGPGNPQLAPPGPAKTPGPQGTNPGPLGVNRGPRVGAGFQAEHPGRQQPLLDSQHAEFRRQQMMRRALRGQGPDSPQAPATPRAPADPNQPGFFAQAGQGAKNLAIYGLNGLAAPLDMLTDSARYTLAHGSRVGGYLPMRMLYGAEGAKAYSDSLREHSDAAGKDLTTTINYLGTMPNGKNLNAPEVEKLLDREQQQMIASNNRGLAGAVRGMDALSSTAAGLASVAGGIGANKSFFKAMKEKIKSDPLGIPPAARTSLASLPVDKSLPGAAYKTMFGPQVSAGGKGVNGLVLGVSGQPLVGAMQGSTAPALSMGEMLAHQIGDAPPQDAFSAAPWTPPEPGQQTAPAQEPTPSQATKRLTNIAPEVLDKLDPEFAKAYKAMEAQSAPSEQMNTLTQQNPELTAELAAMPPEQRAAYEKEMTSSLAQSLENGKLEEAATAAAGATSGAPPTEPVVSSVSNMASTLGTTFDGAYQSFMGMSFLEKMLLVAGVALPALAMFGGGGVMSMLLAGLGLVAGGGFAASQGMFGEQAQTKTKGMLGLAEATINDLFNPKPPAAAPNPAQAQGAAMAPPAANPTGKPTADPKAVVAQMTPLLNDPIANISKITALAKSVDPKALVANLSPEARQSLREAVGKVYPNGVDWKSRAAAPYRLQLGGVPAEAADETADVLARFVE